MTSFFFDNDVISKLAACDLLDDAVAAMGATNAQVFVLSTFKYRYGLTKNTSSKRQRREQELGKATVQRYARFQQDVGEIQQAPGDLLLLFEDVLLLFEDVIDIDSGEAGLFAAACAAPGSLVVTGDKRCLISLATSAACSDVASRLASRVMCLEQVIDQVLILKGFEYTRRRILPPLAATRFLKSCLGKQTPTKQRFADHCVCTLPICGPKRATCSRITKIRLLGINVKNFAPPEHRGFAILFGCGYNIAFACVAFLSPPSGAGGVTAE